MLPRRWKIFRIVCILQTILAGFCSGLHFVYFMQSGSGIQVLNVICFAAIALFASLGTSLIANNYPDTLLSTSQKRYFNYQYIINFLLISFIIAHLYNQRWVLFLMGLDLSFTQNLLMYTPITIFLLILVFQLRILYGMFRLRRELYHNYLKLVDEIASEPVSQ